MSFFKNNEQKGAKAALMTLNLIGIPCQVWPWEDSHSWSDSGCACTGKGVCVSAELWMNVDNCVFICYKNLKKVQIPFIIVLSFTTGAKKRCQPLCAAGHMWVGVWEEGESKCLNTIIYFILSLFWHHSPRSFLVNVLSLSVSYGSVCQERTPSVMMMNLP